MELLQDYLKNEVYHNEQYADEMFFSLITKINTMQEFNRKFKEKLASIDEPDLLGPLLAEVWDFYPATFKSEVTSSTNEISTNFGT